MGLGRLSRRAAAWIAIGAILLLLARPVCEFWHAIAATQTAPPAAQMLAHEADDGAARNGDAPCCLDASSGFVVTLVKVLASGGGFHPTPIAPPFVPLAALILALVAALTARAPQPARRTCPSFYLRCARILR